MELFYRGGAVGAECIRQILKKNGLDIAGFKAILDFGCGCGRIMRHWRTLNGPALFGTDYNPCLVNWCKQQLPLAEYGINLAHSKLDYEDEKFDFIYTISVFTHLSREVQDFWLRELTRTLKAGGYLLVTVHGTTRVHQLSSQQRRQFESGELVIVHEELSGTNGCATYHPEKYVREHFSGNLRVVDFVPGGSKDADQDAFLFQKAR